MATWYIPTILPVLIACTAARVGDRPAARTRAAPAARATARIDGSTCGPSGRVMTMASPAGTPWGPTSTTERQPRTRCGEARPFCSRCSDSVVLEAGGTIWQGTWSRRRRQFSMRAACSLVTISRDRRPGLTGFIRTTVLLFRRSLSVPARQDRVSSGLSSRPS